MDDSIGDYPQTRLSKAKAAFKWQGKAPGPDEFTQEPIPKMKLAGQASWTDVLSCGLPTTSFVGHLLNEKALAVFKSFDLGRFREYPMTVLGKKVVERPYTFLLVRNELPPERFDFARSEFHVVDMVSMPQNLPVKVGSYEKLLGRKHLAREGELDCYEKFSRIEYLKCSCTAINGRRWIFSG